MCGIKGGKIAREETGEGGRERSNFLEALTGRYTVSSYDCTSARSARSLADSLGDEHMVVRGGGISDELGVGGEERG